MLTGQSPVSVKRTRSLQQSVTPGVPRAQTVRLGAGGWEGTLEDFWSVTEGGVRHGCGVRDGIACVLGEKLVDVDVPWGDLFTHSWQSVCLQQPPSRIGSLRLPRHQRRPSNLHPSPVFNTMAESHIVTSSIVLFKYFFTFVPYFFSTMHRPNPRSRLALFMIEASSMS